MGECSVKNQAFRWSEAPTSKQPPFSHEAALNNWTGQCFTACLCLLIYGPEMSVFIYSTYRHPSYLQKSRRKSDKNKICCRDILLFHHDLGIQTKSGVFRVRGAFRLRRCRLEGLPKKHSGIATLFKSTNSHLLIHSPMANLLIWFLADHEMTGWIRPSCLCNKYVAETMR